MKITELDTLIEAGGYVARNAKEAADPRFSMSIGGDVTTHTMRDMIADFYPVKPQKGDKQSVVKESKIEMCPDACCGQPVTECTCGPDCKHCDCYEKNNKVNANRNYGMRKASGQGDNPMMAEKRPDHEVEMAKADVHKLAEYSSKLENLIANISEEEGLPGWIQKKITLASDYIGSVYHKLDHEMGSPITESDTPGFDMINKIFDGLTDEEKVDIQRQLTVKVRGISVPPVSPNLGKLKDRNPNDKDIADMPLAQLQKQYSAVVGEGDGRKKGIHPKGHPMRKKQQAAIHAGESANKPLSRFSTEIGIQEIDCWDGYKKDGTKPGTGKNKGKRVNNCVKEEEVTLSEDQNFHEEFGYLGYALEEGMFEAEYQGRKVKLNKPMRGDVKKFKVYVKDPKTGNVKKVNFGHGGTSAKKAGQKTMKIKKSNPARRKSFRARHNCDNPGPKTKARYWSCRAW